MISSQIRKKGSKSWWDSHQMKKFLLTFALEIWLPCC